MAHPPGAGQSRGRRPLRTAQGSPGEGEGKPVDESVRGGAGVGVGRQLNSGPDPVHPPPPPPLTSAPGPPASHGPDRSPLTPVEPRGPALGTVAQRGLRLLPPPRLRLRLPDSLPSFLLPSALGRRHRRFYFRPRRGSKGRSVPPRAGCGVIHTFLPSHAAPLAPPLELRNGDEPKEPDVGSLRAEVAGGAAGLRRGR